VLDSALDVSPPYVVSEYIDGASLAAVVGESGPLSGGDLDELAIGAVAALAAIHSAGVVHRDFKPANVLLGPDGPRVIDFGIAKSLDATATLTNHTIGTPAYMAPEQISGAVVGPAADMFAWAATIVFAAAGRAPFSANSVPAILHKITTASPDLSALPDHIRDIVAACLAKDPAKRPSADTALRALLAESTAAGPLVDQAIQATKVLPPPAAHPVPARRSTRRWIMRAIPVIVVVAAAIGWMIVPGVSDNNEPEARTGDTSSHVPAWMQTTWAGVTDSPDRPWTVRLAFGSDGRTGEFSLPSLECSGTFDVVRADRIRSATTAAEIRTTMTRRPDRRCPPDELLRVEHEDDPAGAGWVRLSWPADQNGDRLSAELAEASRLPRPTKAMRGTWSGVISPGRRTIRLTITVKSGIVGTVEYPGQNCRGRLAIVWAVGEPGADQGARLIGDFHPAGSRCDFAGTYDISRSYDRGTIRRGLEVRYVSADGGTVGKGTLRRDN